MEEGGRCRGNGGTSLNTAVLVSDPAGLSCFSGHGLYARPCGTDTARAVPCSPPGGSITVAGDGAAPWWHRGKKN